MTYFNINVFRCAAWIVGATLIPLCQFVPLPVSLSLHLQPRFSSSRMTERRSSKSTVFPNRCIQIDFRPHAITQLFGYSNLVKMAFVCSLSQSLPYAILGHQWTQFNYRCSLLKSDFSQTMRQHDVLHTPVQNSLRLSTWATMDRIPITPMNTAIVVGEKLMTCDRKKQRDGETQSCISAWRE